MQRYLQRQGIGGRMEMELTAHVFTGWSPRLRPAASRREWMDAAPASFPYRRLPLKIADEHGWELLSPCGFTAGWNSGRLAGDGSITADSGTSGLEPDGRAVIPDHRARARPGAFSGPGQ